MPTGSTAPRTTPDLQIKMPGGNPFDFGSSIFNTADNPYISQLLSKSLTGPQYKDTLVPKTGGPQITSGQFGSGWNRSGGAVPSWLPSGSGFARMQNPGAYTTQKVLDPTSGFTPQDFMKAMLTENQIAQDAYKVDAERKATANKALWDNLQTTVADMQKRAAGVGQQAQDIMGRMLGRQADQQKQIAGMADTLNASGQNLVTDITKRVGEDQATFDKSKQATLANYKDTTAQNVENQRMATAAQYQQSRQQIMDQAKATGMRPDDPAVQAQLQQLDANRRAQLSQMSNDTQMLYNNTVAQLNTTLTQMEQYGRITGTQTIADAGKTALGLQGQSMDTKIAAMMHRDSVDQWAAGFSVGLDQLRVNLQTAADNLRMSGYEFLANVAEKATTFVSPVADFLAWGLTEFNKAKIEQETALRPQTTIALAQAQPTTQPSPQNTQARPTNGQTAKSGGNGTQPKPKPNGQVVKSGGRQPRTPEQMISDTSGARMAATGADQAVTRHYVNGQEPVERPVQDNGGMNYPSSFTAYHTETDGVSYPVPPDINERLSFFQLVNSMTQSGTPMRQAYQQAYNTYMRASANVQNDLPASYGRWRS